jgi:mono/diheme cytochrome c family protein
MKAFFRALLLLIFVGTTAAAVAAYAIVIRGLSTRVEPSAVEEAVARVMRTLATPASVRAMPNPVAPTDDVLSEALEHFADHCASCHANDGSGQTEMGRSFYPPAPDMRAARTQDLTDGELFSIIEHGIRLTGMPAWGTGTPEGEAGSWGLVHFIRRLPALSPEDLLRMEEFNPKSPAQFREEEEIRRFLSGESEPPPPAAPGEHVHKPPQG